MKYEDPKYLFPKQWINHTEGIGRPAGIWLLDGRLRLAARRSAAEWLLQRAGAVYVATLTFDRAPYESTRPGATVAPVAPARLVGAGAPPGAN